MATEYNTLLRSPQWFEKRKIILARDNNKCRSCGATNGLHVHHRQYHFSKRTGQKQLPWKYQNKYLITLCDKCHTAGHSKFKVPTFTIS
jgi:5-methylcytosine-specific restriction endonuclease McrA